MKGRPSVVFAMRYPSQVGFVHNSMARIYDRAAALLAPNVTSLIAFPELSAEPAFAPVTLEPIEANLYAPDAGAALDIVARRHDVRAVIYMGADTAEIDLPWLRRHGVATINYEQESYPEDATQPAWKAVSKRLLRGRLKWGIHDLYVANAHRQRDFLLRFAGLPLERIVTIVNGVDTDYFTPGPRPNPADLGVPPAAHYVVTVCQARPEKRIEFLIDVAALVFQRAPDASIVFVHVGAGECLEAWKARATQHGLDGRFVFAGFRNDVLPFQRIASVLAHVAERESFGFVIAEAMATGHPVVATDAAGPREIIQDGITGFVVPADDQEMFSRRLIELCTDPVRASEMGRKARERAVSEFGLRRQADQLASAIAPFVK